MGKKTMLSLFFVFLNSLNCLALQPINQLNLETPINQALKYIQSNQVKTTDELYMRGEWPAQMKAYLIPALLGVGNIWGKPVEEPTIFTTASVINLLSEVYFLKPRKIDIPQIIRNSLPSFNSYKDGDLYSYYQWQDYNGVQVKAPKAQNYAPEYLMGLTNIPSDADTTSTTYLSLAYAQQILENKSKNEFLIPDSVLKTFSNFRDLRRTPHYYNRFDGIKNSGAFLTWFYDDYDSKMPTGVFDKPDKGIRIPFAYNDVDVVVNANVLRLLQTTHNENIAGYSQACDLLNKIILNQQQKSVGIYYPNSYAVFYTISNVYKAGADCLQKSKDTAIKTILENQKVDGSWDNHPGIGRIDNVQSTALAINALINYDKNERIASHKNAIRAAISFLISKAKKINSDEIYWEGEVFFSAIAQARNTVLWRSSAYTTALVTLSLANAQNYLGEFNE